MEREWLDRLAKADPAQAYHFAARQHSVCVDAMRWAMKQGIWTGDYCDFNRLVKRAQMFGDVIEMGVPARQGIPDG